MLTFLIRPFRGKPWYVKVYIFPDNATMISHLKTMPRYKGSDLRLHGMATSARFKWHGKQSRKVGEVFLYEGCSGSSVVAHELLHIALGMVRSRELIQIYRNRSRSLKFKWACEGEEKLCDVMGKLVGAYWDQWYKYFEIDKAGENQTRKAMKK